MSLARAEDHLFNVLTRPHSTADEHCAVFEYEKPATLEEIAAIGLDTNVLKFFRTNPTEAESLAFALDASGVELVVPAQVTTEYWNNHKVFSGEAIRDVEAAVKRAHEKLTEGGVGRYSPELTDSLNGLVQKFSEAVKESAAPGVLSDSQAAIRTLLSKGALHPSVSRLRFAALAEARYRSKNPPGFEDGKTKTSSHGDFFVWADFLLGTLLTKNENARSKYVFVTEEKKADWRTDERGHPALLEEFYLVKGAELSLMTYSELNRLLKAQPKKAVGDGSAGDENEPDEMVW